MATHSSILAWRIPMDRGAWQATDHGVSKSQTRLKRLSSQQVNIWRRKWQPTPIFLPGESLWTEEPGGLQSTEAQRVGHD